MGRQRYIRVMKSSIHGGKWNKALGMEGINEKQEMDAAALEIGSSSIRFHSRSFLSKKNHSERQ